MLILAACRISSIQVTHANFRKQTANIHIRTLNVFERALVGLIERRHSQDFLHHCAGK
jgi:hypothetical protein